MLKKEKDNSLYALLYRPKSHGSALAVYVGITTNLCDRMKSHQTDKEIYNVYVLKSQASPLDEDDLTVVLARELGWNIVKGGSYCGEGSQSKLLTAIQHFENRCFKCDQPRIGNHDYNCKKSFDSDRHRKPLDETKARALLAYILCK